jgi:hypothetical protein
VDISTAIAVVNHIFKEAITVLNSIFKEAIALYQFDKKVIALYW